MSAEARRGILRPLLETLTVEACQHAFSESWSAGELAVYALGNLDLGADAARLLEEAWETSQAIPVEPRDVSEVAPFAYASDPSRSGEIQQRELIQDLDFTTVLFANGVRLNVKATRFEAGEMRFEARLGEGRLSLEPADAALGFFEEKYFLEGGLQAHDLEEAGRLDAGMRVSLRFEIGLDSFQFHGETTGKDLLRLLELFCAYLQAPGWRDTGYQHIREHLPAFYEALSHEHRGPVITGFLSEVFAGDPRATFPARERLEAIRLEDLRAWIEPCLIDGPLEVAIVGDLDVQVVIDAAARTLGLLPSRRYLRVYQEHRNLPRPRSAIHQRHEIDTRDRRSLVMALFPMPDGFLTRRAWLGDLLAEILADRLRVHIRERLGASYVPQATAQLSSIMPDVGTLIVQVQTAPADAERVLEACLDITDQLAREGPALDEVSRLRMTARKRVVSAHNGNRRWAELLSEAYRDIRALEELRSHAPFLYRVQPGELADLARPGLAREQASTVIVHPRER